jgi:hypothetical protein
MTVLSRVYVCGVCALFLLGTATVDARAQTSQAAGSSQTLQSQNPNAFFPPGGPTTAPRKSLQWDASGHWTLNLDMDEPVGRDMDWKDVSAGAYFHITPSMRIGGSVGLGDKFSDPQHILPEDTINAPRVHLETKFKF